MMTIQEELLKDANKLDYTWYCNLKKMFLSEQGYDPETKKAKIFISGHSIGYDPETGENCPDEIKYCRIKEYCWEYDFENLRIEENNSPTEGCLVSMSIEKTIATYLNDLSIADLKEFRYSDIDIQKHYFVASAYTIVRNKIIEFQESANDPEYTSSLTYFLLRLRDRLYFHYGKFKEKATRVSKIEAFIGTIGIKATMPVKKISKKEVVGNLTFGIKVDKKWLVETLKVVQVQLEIVDEDKCTIDEMVAILVAKDIRTIKKEITLKCELTQFVYLMNKISQYCSNPPATIIEKAGCFYSKRGNKITANNLYQATHHTPSPKGFEKIDAIFK